MPRLAYYGQQWPFPQGAAAGPYPMFAGPLRGAAQPGTCIIVGRRMIHLAPQKKRRPCPCSHRRRGLRGLGDGTPEIPSGSTIRYTVTYSQNLSTPAPTDFITSFNAGLAAFGYAPAGANLVSNTYLGLGSATIQFLIVDNVGNALQADAQGNLDSLAKRLTYNSVTGSNVAVISSPATPASAPGVGPNSAAAAQDLLNYNAAITAGDSVAADAAMAQYQVDSGASPGTNSALAWLEKNGVYVAGGVLAFAVLRQVL